MLHPGLAVLTAQARQLLALKAVRAVISDTAIIPGLFDPARDGRGMGLELPDQALDAVTGAGQRDDSTPEVRKLCSLRSQHMDTVL